MTKRLRERYDFIVVGTLTVAYTSVRDAAAAESG
jgi:hypothetical protein